MADDLTLQVVMKLKDQASGELKKLGKEFEQAGKQLMGLGVAATAAMTKLAVDAGKTEGIKNAFRGIAGDADKMLAALQRGSAGMTSNAELMRTYNQAAQLVSKTFADQLPDAMQYLTKVSAATGQSMDYMMNSLVIGVGRLSPRILDNLAIQVSLEEATARAAQMFGVEADALSVAQQQAGMMSVVMEKLQANTAQMPETAGSAAAQWASFQATLANAGDEIGTKVLPAFNELLTNLVPLISTVATAVTPGFQFLATALGQVAKALQGVSSTSVAAIGSAGALAWALAPLGPIGMAVGAAIGLVGGTLLTATKGELEFASGTEKATRALVASTKTFDEYWQAVSDGAMVTKLSAANYALLKSEISSVGQTMSTGASAIQLNAAALRDLATAADTAGYKLMAALDGKEIASLLDGIRQVTEQHLTDLADMAQQGVMEQTRAQFEGQVEQQRSTIEHQARMAQMETQFQAKLAAAKAAGNADAVTKLTQSYEQQRAQAEQGYSEQQAIASWNADIQKQITERGALEQRVVQQTAYVKELEAQKKKIELSITMAVLGNKQIVQNGLDSAKAYLNILGISHKTQIDAEIENQSKLLEIQADSASGQIDILESLVNARNAVNLEYQAALDELGSLQTDLDNYQINMPPLELPPLTIPDDYKEGVKGTVDRAAESVAASFASALDGLLSNIASIRKRLSEQLPDIVTPVNEWLDALTGVGQQVGDYLADPTRGMGAFIDWMNNALRPMLEKWASAVEPIATLLNTASSIMDVTAQKIPQVETTVTQFLNLLRGVMLEAGKRFDIEPGLVAFIDWFNKDLRPMLEKWAASVKPLTELLTLGTNAMKALTDKMPPLEGSVTRLLNLLRGVMLEAGRRFDVEPGLQGFIDWFSTDLKPLLEKWVADVKPIVDLLTSAKAITDILTVKLERFTTPVASFYDAVTQFMQDTAAWFYSQKKDDSAFSLAVLNLGFQNERIVAMKEALVDLLPTIETVKGVLDVAAAETSDMLLSVPDFFGNVVSFMESVTEWFYSQKQLDSPLQLAIGNLRRQSELMRALTAALEPLLPAVQAAQSLLEVGSADIGRVKLSIDRFFGNTVIMMQKIAVWLADAANYRRLDEAIASITGFEDMFDGIKTALDPLLAALGPVQSLLDLGSEEVKPLKLNIDQFFGNLMKMMADIGSWFTAQNTLLPGGLVAFMDNYRKTFEPLIDAFAGAVAPIGEFASVVDEMLTKGQALNPSRVSAVFKGYIRQTLTNLKQELEWMQDDINRVTPLAASLAGVFSAVMDDVTAAIQIVAIGVPAEGAGFQEGVLSEFVRTLANVLGQAQAELMTFYTWVASTFKALMAGLTLRPEGAALSNSFALGIRDGIPAIEVAARAAAEAANAAYRDALEFGSPSKVGLRNGAGYTNAIAMGIIRAIPALEKALQEISDRMVPHSPIKKGPLKGWTNDTRVDGPLPPDPKDKQPGDNVGPFPAPLYAPSMPEQYERDPSNTTNVNISIALTGPVSVRSKKDMIDLAGAIDQRLQANMPKIVNAVDKAIAKRTTNRTRYGVSTA